MPCQQTGVEVCGLPDEQEQRAVLNENAKHMAMSAPPSTVLSWTASCSGPHEDPFSAGALSTGLEGSNAGLRVEVAGFVERRILSVRELSLAYDKRIRADVIGCLYPEGVSDPHPITGNLLGPPSSSPPGDPHITPTPDRPPGRSLALWNRHSERLPPASWPWK